MYQRAETAVRGSQSGAILVIVLLLMTVLLGALVIAIDLPHKDNVDKELRAALDLASLAAARELDGSAEGVARAVAAANYTVQHNSPKGASITFDPDDDIALGFYGKIHCAEHQPPCSDSACRACQDADGQQEIYHFQELCKAGDTSGSFRGLPISAVANAVKLSATAEPAIVFSRIFGAESSGSVRVRSAAAADQSPEECVFPYGVPACQLFLNPNANESALALDYYDAQGQCGRDLIFTESSMYDPWVWDKRGKGYVYSSFMPRQPSIRFTTDKNDCGYASGTTGPNCRLASLPGVLALPLAEGEDPGAAADPKQILELLESWASGKSDEQCLRVPLGASLKPLDNGVDDVYGLLSNEALRDRMGRAMAALLTEPAPATAGFSEVFGDVMDPDNPPQPNYPFLRNNPIDRILRWEPFTAAQQILMPAMGEWQWTNPLCHDARIPANDRARARVREVTVMALVPGDERFSYCDFAAHFEGAPLNAWPPYNETKPIVAGFVKVYLFDFNYDDLGERPDSGLLFADLPDAGPLGIVEGE